MSDQQTEQALGKYTILRELGRGGFATVYLAQDNVLRRSIALKILHPMLLADPDFVRRFEQEAHATAQLDHPHIAAIYELGQLEGRLYIAIQLLVGGTLADRIRQRGPLPFAETVRVVGEIAEALDHAHAAGFVHRDVKPTNILFNARDEAVLTDFGMVKAVESSVIARSTMGNVIGTPPYIAPEIWEGKQDGPGTDVYALGCVLFEMLTGELLFKGNTPPAVMLAHFQRHQYPARWPEGVPPEVEALLERALSRELGDRHVSAGALATDLRDLTARAADPLAERYRALQSAIAAQDWERASQLAQEIAAQNPGYRDLPTLARQAAEGQTRAAQVGWAAQWREQALAAERAGQPDAARAAAQRWLEMAPGDGEARALLARLITLDSRGTSDAQPLNQFADLQSQSVESRDAQAVAQWARAETRPASSTTGRDAMPVPTIWPSILLTTIGWAIAGASGRLAGASGRLVDLILLDWVITGTIGGLITGFALRRIDSSIRWKQILIFTIGWLVSWVSINIILLFLE
jgi:hypothetical protein